MGTVGVQLPSGAITVKFEDSEVYCDHHMTGAVFQKVQMEKKKDAVQTVIGTLSQLLTCLILKISSVFSDTCELKVDSFADTSVQ